MMKIRVVYDKQRNDYVVQEKFLFWWFNADKAVGLHRFEYRSDDPDTCLMNYLRDEKMRSDRYTVVHFPYTLKEYHTSYPHPEKFLEEKELTKTKATDILHTYDKGE